MSKPIASRLDPLSVKYGGIGAALLGLKLVYNHVLNKHNRVEYYYWENTVWRYRILRASVVFLHLVMIFYLRYIFFELIKLV